MFYNKKRILCVLLLSQLSFSQEFVNPFDLTPILPENLWGWFGIQNQKHLEKFILEKRPKKVVEVGTWLGRSAIFIAQRLQPGAKLFCIDPWVPYKDMENMPECQDLFKTVYQQFLSNCIHQGVTDKVKPMKMTSMEALDYFESDIDLIYLDGSHQEDDAYNDIVYWYTKLSPDGILCGDDIGWPSVHRALMRAEKKINVTVKSDDNFWWIERN